MTAYAPVNFREKLGLIVERRGVPNTGDAGGERTGPGDVWV